MGSNEPHSHPHGRDHGQGHPPSDRDNAPAGHDRARAGHGHAGASGHAHDHGAGHSHSRALAPTHAHGDHAHTHHASYGKLLVSFWIISGFMLVEITCGWLFHSLTLMSDGFHMLSDAVALGLSAFAVSLGARKATEEKTFGFKRLEILAAFGNGLTLILLSVFIIGQALVRLARPLPVDAG